MAVTPGQVDVLREARQRSYAEGGIFWFGADQLAIFDPAVAQAVNAHNFSDLALPDQLSDILRGREGKKIYWREVRELWLSQVRRLSEPAQLELLAARMEKLLDERAGSERDLVWVGQEVISRSLLPVVINGLDEKDTARVLADQDQKIRFNVVVGPPDGLFKRLGNLWVQLLVGNVVRRELRGRAAGTRPRQLDLTDPIVDFLPELGIGRAVDAVTGILTAIGGPPGGAAACLIYALLRYPEWRAKLAEELAGFSLAELCAAPTRHAPIAHRFVRETLRLWSPTPIVGRAVRKELEAGGHCLRPGQEYLLSPDILHHDPRFWKDPDLFDPDRWLSGAERAPHSAACYAPFGWAPRGCIGAGLGSAQLILLTYLLLRRFQIELATPDQIGMALPSMPVPQNLKGTLTRISPETLTGGFQNAGPG